MHQGVSPSADIRWMDKTRVEVFDGRVAFQNEDLARALLLQYNLANISESNMDSVLIYIKKNGYLKNEWNLLQFFHHFIIISYIRPNNVFLFSIILEMIVREFNNINVLKRVVTSLLSNIHRLDLHWMLDYLSNNGIIKEKSYVIFDNKDFKRIDIRFDEPKEEPTTLLNIIQKDDIEALMKFSGFPDFDFNQFMPYQEKHVCLRHGVTLIQCAAFYAALSCFKYLLNNGSDLNKKSHANENTVDYFAVIGGNFEIIKILESKNFNCSLKALYISISFHRYELFDWLFERYKAKNMITEQLYVACIGFNFYYGLKKLVFSQSSFFHSLQFQRFFGLAPEMVSYLFTTSFRSNANEVAGFMILRSNEIMTEFCINQYSFDTNAKYKGYSLLALALKVCNSEIIWMFLKRIDVSFRTILINNVKSLLLVSVLKSRCDFDIFSFLVDKKEVDVNALYEVHNPEKGSIYSTSVIFDCVEAEDLRYLEKILKRPDLDVNQYFYRYDKQNRVSCTPFYCACIHQNNEAIEIFLKDSRTDINALSTNNNKFCYPLITLVKGRNYQAVEMLLRDPRTNVNISDNMEGTPLIYACMTDNPAMVRLLLAHPKTNINQVFINTNYYNSHDNSFSKCKKYALLAAAHVGSEEIVKTLLSTKKLKKLSESDYAILSNKSHLREKIMDFISKTLVES